jgi:hypothetical protein
MISDHIIVTITLDTTVAVYTITRAVVFNEATWWRHRPWRGVNTFGDSVYSKEYAFPILLNSRNLI